uniref:NADH dehydrogenase subunit 4L n=1 Tax=Pyropia perforata TaxID=182771 RepID=A0A060D8B0_PYRPE|nr:NADH dehydrogenase subunit 4L [Neoporphyra perforata]AHB35413.1 NADH dehydrogenase subunit 4L [Neoporphyra perforata]AIB08101.1 NADH dehydrogenase subunit 4L [Neoporphyra perforata]AIB08190.1 NADH dehydrogenase subunit 4L [Neoporphyra perforata]AIB08247.1 NADH dehydrogenase subunit 4L [Neoporphyra perforata]
MITQLYCENYTFFLFFLGVLGIFLNQKSIIIVIMSLEIMFLSVSFNFIYFSIYLDNIIGQLFALAILTVAASESSIGLAILVVYYRIRNTITIELMSLTKG